MIPTKQMKQMLKMLKAFWVLPPPLGFFKCFPLGKCLKC